jgi:hypothetical protein
VSSHRSAKYARAFLWADSYILQIAEVGAKAVVFFFVCCLYSVDVMVRSAQTMHKLLAHGVLREDSYKWLELGQRPGHRGSPSHLAECAAARVPRARHLGTNPIVALENSD